MSPEATLYSAVCLLAALVCGCSAEEGESPPGPVSAIDSIALEDAAATSANASLGDLDGDGDLDIVLAKGRHWPLVDFVLLNDGTGEFAQRHEVGGDADRTYTAALADLDGDLDLDLVVGNDRPDDKRIYLNDGTGHFRLASTFGQAEWPTRNITVVDLNGDQRPEIVVANRGGPENLSANQVCINSGDGTFARCEELSTDSATTIAAGDLDHDGSSDLMVPHRDGGQSYVYLNDRVGRFLERRPIGPASASTRAVALGDLDGNGTLDVVMGDSEAGGALLYLNRGDATFEPALPLAEGTGLVYSIAIGDLDLDGDLDLVFGNREAPGVIATNDGSGRKFDIQPFGDGEGTVYGLAIGDLDGDATPEIIAARSDAANTLYRLRRRE